MLNFLDYPWIKRDYNKIEEKVLKYNLLIVKP